MKNKPLIRLRISEAELREMIKLFSGDEPLLKFFIFRRGRNTR